MRVPLHLYSIILKAKDSGSEIHYCISMVYLQLIKNTKKDAAQLIKIRWCLASDSLW